MQILIGYLVALAVLLGGGYAGMQWLAAPEEPGAAVADGSHAASASTSRALQAKKLREARALHRKLAESRADGVKPAAAPSEPDVSVAAGEGGSAKLADGSLAPAGANASTAAAAPEIPNPTAVPNNPKLDARAEVRPAAKKIKAVQSEADARQRPAETESVAARKSTDTRDASASEPTADRSEAITKKKPAVNRTAAVSKKKRAVRFASSSRKPVMMVLRTIEFADGRREQRLLPMAEARSEPAHYGNVSAFTDDDDF